MAKLVRKLTAESLKKMIQEEARNLKTETSDPIASGAKQTEKVSAEEVEAEDLAGSLEKDLDYMKALKIHEQRLTEKLSKIQEAKEVLSKRITQNV
jgi:hypothetical protein